MMMRGGERRIKMTIKEVNDYLKKNANKDEYEADKLVNDGYGQTKGGYRDNAQKFNIKDITQKWHFTESYYKSIKDTNKKPTFFYLRCPELLIWIAEVAGLNNDLIQKAIDHVKKFEKGNNLVGTEKSGNYFCSGLQDLKNILHIYELNKIIGESVNWDEVIEKSAAIK
ncbi:MAG: hypothetical protein LUG91_03185 [Ruminococcus sp.]|nr:hypothetical protein [Ruminococcus sp.]